MFNPELVAQLLHAKLAESSEPTLGMLRYAGMHIGTIGVHWHGRRRVYVRHAEQQQCTNPSAIHLDTAPHANILRAPRAP